MPTRAQRKKSVSPRKAGTTPAARNPQRATTSGRRGVAAPGGPPSKAAATRKKPPRPKLKRRRESQADRAARAERILFRLREAYPAVECALHHRSAYELLVATILSAQCTDERVNQVTPELFRRYPDAAALAAAEPAELEQRIKSTGFFRNKTKSLLGMAAVVRDRHGGAIPDTMDALLELPGVARKTANCVLGTWFGRNEGIVVDTHVGRIAARLALTTSARDDKDAPKIERDLMALFPRDSWTWLAHALIAHGRQVCTARSPKCGACPLAEDCPAAGKV